MTQLACVDATVTRREELSEHLVRVHVAGEQLRTMPWGEQGPGCLLYTSPSPRDLSTSRMPSSA